MREIKFKALSEVGQWLYGDLVHNAYDGTSGMVEIGIRNRNSYPIAIKPETVCQYIGTVDNTGRQIFSGDILITSRGRIKVLYIERHSAYLGVGINDEWDDFLYTFDKEEFVIVGNIHEP